MKLKDVLRNKTLSFKIGFVIIFIGVFLLIEDKFKASITKISFVTPIASSQKNISNQAGKVTKIIDGDTIEIDNGILVRYIGINTPEIETDECFSTEAAKANSDLVWDKNVTLIKDTSETDKYGRLLRYVYVDDEFVNNILVKDGYAKVMTVFPDTKMENTFVVSEKYAESNLLGLWGKCGK